MKKAIPFLRHFHYFRAFAIVNIVFAHLWALPDGLRDEKLYGVIDMTREAFFHNTTIYFLFISGFLFQYLSPKFRLKKYYVAKLSNVVSPYIFITLGILFLRTFLGAHPDFTAAAFVPNAFDALITGNIQIQFWYIPFIIIIFVFSPLLLELSPRQLGIVVAFTVGLPLLGTRTGTQITLLQFVYFLPVYLLGMYVALAYDKMQVFFQRFRYLFLGIVVLSFPVILHLPPDQAFFGVFNPVESLHYLQKIAITFLCLLYFQRFENTSVPALNILAEYSFSIYFLHVFIGNNILFKESFYRLAYYLLPEMAFFFSLLHVFLSIGITVALCFIGKKILGKYAKFVLGV